MDDAFAVGVTFVVGMALGFLIGGFAIGIDAMNEKDRVWRDAISRGYAEYCPEQDNFAFKGECAK